MGTHSLTVDHNIEGGAAAGQPVQGNPVQIGYVDGSGNVQYAASSTPIPVVMTGAPTVAQDVNLTQVGGVTLLRGAGATGTGSARTTVAQDVTTIAGSAPGTAGTSSANVLTVQGRSGMTPLVVGPQASAANSYSRDTDFGVATAHTAKGSAGSINAFDATSINAAVRYFQIHNRAVTPVTDDVPIYSFAVQAGSATAPARLTMGQEFFGLNGEFLSTGVSWGWSTAVGTYQAGTASDHVTHVHYV